MIVQDIMTEYPEALGPEDTIRKAAELMRSHDYGMVPILDGMDALIGVITDRDIVVQAVAKGHGPETLIKECMTLQPDTVPKDLPIGQALHLMNTRQVRRLPVMESGRLIGMVSLSDIAKSNIPENEKSKTLESVSAGGADIRPGADLPEA
ncbi:MAG: CBS domain-containing protein [Janthinobacterium lividum]